MKRFLCAGTVLLVAMLTLAACSDAESPSTANTGGDDGSSGKTPITLTMFEGDSWLSNYINPDWEDPVAQEITRKTGISFDITTAKSANADDDLNILLASGELPDIIFTNSPVGKQQLIEGKYVIPLESYLEDYPHIQESLGSFLNNWRQQDGHIYGLGNWNWNDPKYALNLQINTLYMRYDILKELGYAKLDRNDSRDSFITVDDYLKLLDRVKEHYPDMIPALLDAENAYRVMSMSRGVQRHEDAIYEDGKAKLLYDVSYTTDIIRFLNRLYNQGYVPKDFYLLKQEQVQNRISTGNVFSTLGYIDGLAEAQDALSMDNDEKRLVMFYLQHDSSVQTIYANAYISVGNPSFFISKDSNQVERIMEMIDFMTSEEGNILLNAGVEGVTYTKDASGTLIPDPEIMKGYTAWDANTLKTYGLGGWQGLFPSLAGLDAEGNAYDIYAQSTFDNDRWAQYNNVDSRYFAYPNIISPVGTLNKENQPDAFTAYSKISTYVTDRLTKAIIANSDKEMEEEWDKAYRQMKTDNLDGLNQALDDNWNLLAKTLDRNPARLNQVQGDN